MCYSVGFSIVSHVITITISKFATIIVFLSSAKKILYQLAVIPYFPTLQY